MENSSIAHNEDPFHPLTKFEFFTQLKKIRGRSENTVLAYRRDLELFEEFWVSSKNINSLFDYMKEKGLSPRSQARVVSSLKTYSKFCVSMNVKIPDFKSLKAPPIKATTPQIAITSGQFFQLLKAAEVENDPNRTDRNKVTLYLLYSLGVRASELITLNIDDVNLALDFVLITGKAKSKRAITLNNTLQATLQHYLCSVRENLLTQGTTSSLLINDRGRRPSRIDIWRWLATWSNKAGFDSPLGPQAFRHGCALALKNSGFDIEFLKNLLGHKYSQTTAEFYFGKPHEKPSQKVTQSG